MARGGGGLIDGIAINARALSEFITSTLSLDAKLCSFRIKENYLLLMNFQRSTVRYFVIRVFVMIIVWGLVLPLGLVISSRDYIIIVYILRWLAANMYLLIYIKKKKKLKWLFFIYTNKIKGKNNLIIV